MESHPRIRSASLLIGLLLARSFGQGLGVGEGFGLSPAPWEAAEQEGLRPGGAAALLWHAEALEGGSFDAEELAEKPWWWFAAGVRALGEEIDLEGAPEFLRPLPSKGARLALPVFDECCLRYLGLATEEALLPPGVLGAVGSEWLLKAGILVRIQGAREIVFAQAWPEQGVMLQSVQGEVSLVGSSMATIKLWAFSPAGDELALCDGQRIEVWSRKGQEWERTVEASWLGSFLATGLRFSSSGAELLACGMRQIQLVRAGRVLTSELRLDVSGLSLSDLLLDDRAGVIYLANEPMGSRAALLAASGETLWQILGPGGPMSSDPPYLDLWGEALLLSGYGPERGLLDPRTGALLRPLGGLGAISFREKETLLVRSGDLGWQVPLADPQKGALRRWVYGGRRPEPLLELGQGEGRFLRIPEGLLALGDLGCARWFLGMSSEESGQRRALELPESSLLREDLGRGFRIHPRKGAMAWPGNAVCTPCPGERLSQPSLRLTLNLPGWKSDPFVLPFL